MLCVFGVIEHQGISPPKAKAAFTTTESVSETSQLPIPEQFAPDHPSKLEPLLGIADNVIVRPLR
jgi:hypothetical protein